MRNTKISANQKTTSVNTVRATVASTCLKGLQAACVGVTLLSTVVISAPYAGGESFEGYAQKLFSESTQSLPTAPGYTDRVHTAAVESDLLEPVSSVLTSTEATLDVVSDKSPTNDSLAPDLLAETILVPSQSSINDVVSYYYDGQGVPILAEYKLCSDIGRVGPERNECLGEIAVENLVQEQAVYLWMSYLVPKGTHSELLLHYNHDGITRDASNLKVSGSIRYRTWKKIKLSRSGHWELPIYAEQNGAYTELDRISLNVKSETFAGR